LNRMTAWKRTSSDDPPEVARPDTASRGCAFVFPPASSPRQCPQNAQWDETETILPAHSVFGRDDLSSRRMARDFMIL